VRVPRYASARIVIRASCDTDASYPGRQPKDLIALPPMALASFATEPAPNPGKGGTLCAPASM
jgi:hypothetical protein